MENLQRLAVDLAVAWIADAEGAPKLAVANCSRFNAGEVDIALLIKNL